MTGSTISILRAGPSEFALARQVAVEMSLPSWREGSPLDEAALGKFLADASNYLLIAIEGGQAIGRLYGYALRRPDRNELQFLLYAIDVHPEHRQRGIGSALVDRFAAVARRAGAFEVWVLTNESNRAAMAMYAGVGLRRHHQDDVLLVLHLSTDDLADA